MNQKQLDAFFQAKREAFLKPDAYAAAREQLLRADREVIFDLFRERLKHPDENERGQAIEGLALLYRSDALGLILPLIADPFSPVRWLVCECLHDIGNDEAVPALLERLTTDSDCQVRGSAAAALGNIGALSAMRQLHRTHLNDHEVDELGHSPSSIALEAMTSVLRRWTTRMIAGNPLKTFEEFTPLGHLRGIVRAESIPFDPEGRITSTPRYKDLPMAAFGFGFSSRLNLHTTLMSPFEIEVAYQVDAIDIGRLFVYSAIPNDALCDWAIHTILDPDALHGSA